MAEQATTIVDVQETEKLAKRKALIKKVVIGAIVLIVVWWLYKKFVK